MIETWARTDIGLVRQENQDAYGVRGDACGHTVGVVCDGMGGVKGGNMASNIAVRAFMGTLEESITQEMDWEDLRLLCARGVDAANAAIRQAAREYPENRGMGTTLVAAVVRENTAVVANVGDSRGYLFHRGEVSRVTRDHSLVETLIERGDITEEEARFHPKRNYITRALGPEPTVQCDSYVVSLEPGDAILLCTDGLISTVNQREMAEEIERQPDGAVCLENLIELAKRRGAPDNVTAVLLRKS